MLRKLRNTCVIGGSLLLSLALGCRDVGVYVDAQPRDELLANRIVKLVENEFRNLRSDHPIIARYGEFVSLVPGQVIKGRAHQVFDLDCPASLIIKNCRCVFTKYATRIDVVIHKGAGPQVAFSLTSPEFSPEFLSEHESEYVLVERDGELWFDHGNWGEHGSTRGPSRIDCNVSHPDFQP